MREFRKNRLFRLLGVMTAGFFLVPVIAFSAAETDADRSPASATDTADIEEGNASLEQFESQETRDPQSVSGEESEPAEPMGTAETTEPTHEPMAQDQQPAAQAQAVTVRLNQTEVREIQERLKDLGHYDAQIDGIWGPRTASAVQDFQQAQGLDTTGEINLRTLSALNVYGAGERAPASVPSDASTEQRAQPRGETDRAIDSEIEQPEVDVQDTESL